MKNYALAFIAIIVAVAGSAFTSSRNTGEKWFVYTGLSHDLSELQDASNYESPSESQPCSGDGIVCGIFFEVDDLDQDRPEDFDGTMLEKIRAVVEDGQPSAEVAQEQ